MQMHESDEICSVVSFPCDSCGGLMRLVGSEPDPAKAETDLLTYSCTACGAFKVTPVPLPQPRD